MLRRCQTCVPYMCALHVCLTCVPYMCNAKCRVRGCPPLNLMRVTRAYFFQMSAAAVFITWTTKRWR